MDFFCFKLRLHVNDVIVLFFLHTYIFFLSKQTVIFIGLESRPPNMELILEMMLGDPIV